ncbi:MAG: glycosyltransferase family 1 protein [Anaerolineales bacterium]|nr:MAG: glycosyltransferase family 1 protein [Anaerolineales bacterium]
MSKVVRIAALFSHPIQYFAPLFRALASRPDVDLTTYLCSRQGLEEYVDPGFGKAVSWDIPLLEGYRYKFLPNLRRGQGARGFFSLINPAIVRELQRERYDALWVHGYMHATNWLAFLAARVTDTPILLRGESNLLRPRPWWVRLVKGVVLRALLSQVSACLYIGTRNREYYEHYGVPDERLFFTPYCVDNAFFQAQADHFRPQRNKLREEFGIVDDRPVILFCGKLIPKKQPLRLLEAFAQVRRDFPCALLYVGDGALRSEIEERIELENIPDVRITGFLNQSEVPKAYTAADVLVLPSTWEGGDSETWGLVVNEGMNFGLPIVVTDQVGCAPDLVREGENGYVVPYHSVEELEKALEKLVADPERRYAFGQRSLEIIQGWDIDHTVEGIVHAAKLVGET